MTEKHLIFTSKKAWRRFLLIWFAALLVLGFAGCAVFYRYAGVYENTRAELEMEKLMSSMSKDDWLSELVKDAGSQVNAFDRGDELYSTFFNCTLRDKEFTYRSNLMQSDKTHKVFTVRAAGCNVCTVRYDADDSTGSPGFGRHYWKLGSIELCDYVQYLEGADVEIRVPEGKNITVNGKSVEKSYITGTVDGPDTCAVELRFPERAMYDCYELGTMYGDVSVTDDSGRELEAEYDEESSRYVFTYIPETEELYSLSISAPEGAVVNLNGTELSFEDAEGYGKDIFEEYRSLYGGEEWKTVEYSFSGLYTKPEVTVCDAEGNLLTPVWSGSSKVSFFYAGDAALQSETEGSVRQFFDAYLTYCGGHGPVYGLTAYTYPQSKLYCYFLESSDGMFFASDTVVKDISYSSSNYRQLGNNAFFCVIDYSATFEATSWNDVTTYDLSNRYCMVFIRTAEGWRAAAMEAF